MAFTKQLILENVGNLSSGCRIADSKPNKHGLQSAEAEKSLCPIDAPSATSGTTMK